MPFYFSFFKIGGKKLSGSTYQGKQVDFSLSAFLNQKFQQYFEQDFQKKTGLLGYLVRSDNQLNYFAFHQVSSNPKANVVLGLNNHLIERNYLKSANRTVINNQIKLLQITSTLKKLQASLKSDGIGFLLIISPNKPSFYPESIPAWYRVVGSESRYDSREFMIAELKKQNINFIDGFSFLKEKEAEFDEPMFATSGTHWNELGGCFAASEILRKSAEILKKPLPKIECQISGKRHRPAYQDMDLLRIANLWMPELLMSKAPNVVSVTSMEKGTQLPQLLIIGSSFCWELLRQFEQSKSTAKTEFLYYFKRRIVNSADKGRELDPITFNYKNATQTKDMVIIEINQSFLKRAGFGFPESYLKWRELSAPLK